MDGEIDGPRGWLKRHLRTVALCAITGVGVSAAIAVATVPDGNGVIHTCYQVTAGAAGTVPSPGPNVRVIDPAAGQSCDPAGEVALNFNQQGLPGPQGAQGPAGTQGAAGPAGNDAVSPGDCPATVGHVTLSGSSDFSFDACRILRVKVGARASSESAGSTEYEITRLTDSLSPKLAKATVQGTLFKTATIEVYKPGTTTVGQTLKLSNAAISSFKAGLGQNQPTDVLILISAPKKGT